MNSELTPYGPAKVEGYAEPTAGEELARYREGERRVDLRTMWGFVRRNWWIVGGFLAAGIAGALLFNHHSTPIYQSAATVDLQSQVSTQLPVLTMSSPMATDMIVLGSRSLASGVVDTLDMQVRMSEPRGVPRDSLFSSITVAHAARPGSYSLVRRDGGAYELQGKEGDHIQEVRVGEPFSHAGTTLTLAPSASRHDRIGYRVLDHNASVSQVASRLTVRVPGHDQRAQVLEITYTDPDRNFAAQVPNALIHQFVDYRRHKAKQTAISTVDFLRSQLDTLNTQLRDAELAIRKYRETTHTIDLASETSSQVSQVASLMATRDALVMERAAILDVRAKVVARDTTNPMAPSPYRRLTAFPTLGTVLASPLADLGELESRRSDLLRRRTPDDPDVQILTDQIHDAEKELQGQADAYLVSIQSQISALQPVVERNEGQLAEVPRKEFEMAGLDRTTQILITTASMLQTSLKEAEITKAVDDPSVTVIDLAQVPRKPIRPRRMWNVVLGVLLGLGAGIGVAYSRELLDTRIHTREELREITGVPVLGLIPRMTDMPTSLSFPTRRLFKLGDRGARQRLPDSRALAPRLVAENDRSSAVSEAFRSLRTNITFSSTAERVSKVFVLTSPTPQDGKTTTAANLAVTFAQQGLRVVLADADMRRGLLHKLFGVSRTPGLSNILVENVELDRAIHRVQLEQGADIDVLPTGTVPPNPAELLSSPRMQWLIERLEERYDAVLFDTPPLTLVTDAAILASRAHTVLLVARANQTEEGAVHFAIEQLRNVGAPVRGTILNDVDFRRDGYGGKYNYNAYSYAYESRPEE